MRRPEGLVARHARPVVPAGNRPSDSTAGCAPLAAPTMRFHGSVDYWISVANAQLLDGQAATAVSRLFRVLANDTRVRLLQVLVSRNEASVGELAAALDMRIQAVSNQLQRLADQGVLAVRRDGTRMLYRVDDPCVAELLELGLCLTEVSERSAPRPSAQRRS